MNDKIEEETNRKLNNKMMTKSKSCNEKQTLEYLNYYYCLTFIFAFFFNL